MRPSGRPAVHAASVCRRPIAGGLRADYWSASKFTRVARCVSFAYSDDHSHARALRGRATGASEWAIRQPNRTRRTRRVKFRHLEWTSPLHPRTRPQAPTPRARTP
jgi:hypothetical protein